MGRREGVGLEEGESVDIEDENIRLAKKITLTFSCLWKCHALFVYVLYCQ